MVNYIMTTAVTIKSNGVPNRLPVDVNMVGKQTLREEVHAAGLYIYFFIPLLWETFMA